jgi:hypothetical protein
LTQAILLATAKKAYDWAVAHPSTDDLTKSAQLQAQAWMFKATGDKAYETAFRNSNPVKNATTHLYPEVCGGATGMDVQWGNMVYVTTKNDNVDKTYQDMLKQAYLGWAKYDRVDPTVYRPFRQGWHRRMPPVVGNQTSPEVFIQAPAYFALGAGEEYLNSIFTSNDYALGGNEMNMCFMSRCGYRYPMEIMHDYIWHFNHAKGMPKGVIPYGVHAPFMGVQTVNGVVNYGFGLTTLHPMYRGWGMFELYFENRFCAITNEFTTEQTNGLAAFSYAIVKDGGPGTVHLLDKGGNVGHSLPAPVGHRFSTSMSGKSMVLTFAAPAPRTVELFDLSGKCIFRVSGSDRAMSLPAAMISGCSRILRITVNGKRVYSAPLTSTL